MVSAYAPRDKKLSAMLTERTAGGRAKVAAGGCKRRPGATNFPPGTVAPSRDSLQATGKFECVEPMTGIGRGKNRGIRTESAPVRAGFPAPTVAPTLPPLPIPIPPPLPIMPTVPLCEDSHNTRGVIVQREKAVERERARVTHRTTQVGRERDQRERQRDRGRERETEIHCTGTEKERG